MVNLTGNQAKIDALMKAKWKRMIDLFCEMTECQASFVICDGADQPLVKSTGRLVKSDDLIEGAGCYCKQILKTRKPLVVQESGGEQKESASGVISYIGFPINMPDGQCYGVICLCDQRKIQFWPWCKELLSQHAQTIADDLCALADREKLALLKSGQACADAPPHREEEQFSKVFRLSPAAIIITSADDGVVVDANDSYLNLFGFSREELVGKSGKQMSIFDDPKVRHAIVRRLDNGERVRDYETALLAKTGETRQVLISVDKTEFVGKQCLISTIYDLSSIINLKQNLRTISERFALATRAADMGIWDWYIPDETIVWDDQMLRLYGIRRGDFTGRLNAWLSLVHPQDRESVELNINKALGGQQDYVDEFRIIRPDGQVHHIKAYGNTVRDEQGQPVRMTGVNFDVTAAQQAQNQIQDSEARYRSLFHNNNAIQMIIDSETGMIVDANAAACGFYGYCPEKIRGKHIWDIDASGEAVLMNRIQQAHYKGADYMDTLHQRYDGQQRDMEVFCGRVEMNGHKMLHMIIHDVTERKRTERGLIESENRFRLFVESAPDGVFVEMDGLFAYLNQMAVELFGASSEHELLGKPVASYFGKSSRKKMSAYIRQLNVYKKGLSIVKETIEKSDGGLLEVEVSGVPFQLGGEDGALFFLHDISARRQLEVEKLNMEAQLRQKQKLESIGILAGGVAHEINNPVSGIINYAQLIAESPDAGTDIVEFGNEIIREGNRIAGIVKNLLKFARQEKQSHSLAQVNDVINDTLVLIRTIISKDKIELAVELEPDMPDIKCRSQQIQQVLMNLLTNARDALNARYKGENEKKKIVLRSTQFDNNGRRWVRIIVEDYGMGIPDHVKEKMFDPFFTTKSRNEGTGLGLSISHGIVADHHGALYFETEWGHYTRAILELPVNNGWALALGAEV